MATGIRSTPSRSMCDACSPKQIPAITSCKGCSKDFCRTHFNEHRDALSSALNNVFDKHDTLLQEFQLTNEDAMKPSNNANAQALLQQIDEWKKKTIENVLRAATEASENVERLFSRHLQNADLKERIDNLTKELKEQQESESFVDTDIDQWLKQLEQLRTELNRPLRIDTYPPALQIQNLDWNAVIKININHKHRQSQTDFDTSPSNQRRVIPPSI